MAHKFLKRLRRSGGRKALMLELQKAELFIIHGTANDRQKADERAAARAAAEARKQAERDAYTAMVTSIALS